MADVKGKLLKNKTITTTTNKNLGGKHKQKFSLKQYLNESRDELRKVSWPSRRDTWKNTWIVIAMSLGVAAFLGFWDYIFNYLLEWYLKI